MPRVTPCFRSQVVASGCPHRGDVGQLLQMPVISSPNSAIIGVERAITVANASRTRLRHRTRGANARATPATSVGATNRKHRVRVDEAPDEPTGSDAIDLGPRPRDPHRASVCVAPRQLAGVQPAGHPPAATRRTRPRAIRRQHPPGGSHAATLRALVPVLAVTPRAGP